MPHEIAHRPDVLPDDVQPYRTIGPFDATTLPAGLLSTHRLAEGVWGKLMLEEGEISFVWEDGSNDREILSATAQIIVPPLIPHHLELLGDFRLAITFCRAG